MSHSRKQLLQLARQVELVININKTEKKIKKNICENPSTAININCEVLKQVKKLTYPGPSTTKNLQKLTSQIESTKPNVPP